MAVFFTIPCEPYDPPMPLLYNRKQLTADELLSVLRDDFLCGMMAGPTRKLCELHLWQSNAKEGNILS